MGERTFFLGLQVMQKDDKIFIIQDKYVADILKKFDFSSVRQPDIMFAVCACARFQVTPKISHLHVVKRIFIYLKGQPKLGLWYPRDSPFDLEAFSDSDYVGASLDRKSTTGGCQFLRKRLISWKCKKQTVVSNSTTKAEYVVVANCYGQGQFFQGKGSTVPVESHHTPTCAPSTSPPYLLSPPRSSIRQETKGSGNIDKTSYIPHDSPLPRVNTLRISTGSGRVSIASRMISTTEELVSTVGVSTAGMIDKGKGIMEESESDVVKTKRQQEQERLGLEAAVRLQEEFDKEERQRIARVHEAAQTFSEEEWENIRARVEADKELNQRLQVEERNKYSEVNQEKMLVDLINQRKRYFAKQKAEAKRKNPMTQAQ
nr:hypothetical protein [Tanacetum cinerariifolium]